MLITSYGVNSEGSEGGEKRCDGLFETVKKQQQQKKTNAHFIRGKHPRRGESMSSNKSSPRLHDYRWGKKKKQNPENKVHLFLFVCGRRNKPSTLRCASLCALSFFSPPRLGLQPVRPHRMWCCCPAAQLLSPPFSGDLQHTARTHSSLDEDH